MSKYTKYIKANLTTRDMFEQLAEECSELSQAALKLIRAQGLSSNVTPIKYEEAVQNFEEEVKDVAGVLWLITGNLHYAWADGLPKMERWAGRLGYNGKED